MGVRKIEVLTSEGVGGGRMPLPIAVVIGMQGLPDEVTTFDSISSCRTSWS